MEQGQAHHAGMASGKEADMGLEPALDGVAAGLAAPFPTCKIGRDHRLGQPSDGDDGLVKPVARDATGVDHGQRREHPVPAAGQEPQEGSGLGLGFRLAENASANGDNRVGREDDGTRVAGGDGNSLCRCKPPRKRVRPFARVRGFVDPGRIDRVRNDAEPGKQFEPARRGRCENEPRALGTRQRVRARLAAT